MHWILWVITNLKILMQKCGNCHYLVVKQSDWPTKFCGTYNVSFRACRRHKIPPTTKQNSHFHQQGNERNGNLRPHYVTIVLIQGPRINVETKL